MRALQLPATPDGKSKTYPIRKSNIFLGALFRSIIQSCFIHIKTYSSKALKINNLRVYDSNDRHA